MEAVDLNFRMNASGNAVPELRKAQGAVKRLDTQIQKSNARMRGFNNGITAMQSKTRKFAMGGLQQAGFQIGDYAVQVANGTSKMQAFGQQAPQLLQIFGPIGAIVGAGVAIFAAFGVALQKSAKAAEEAEKEVVTFGQAVSALNKIDTAGLGKQLSAPAKEAMKQYSALLQLMKETAEEQRKTALTDFVQQVVPKESIDELRGRVKAAQLEMQAFADFGDSAKEQIEKAQVKRDKASVALAKELRIMKEISSIQGKTRAEAAASLSTAIEQLTNYGMMSDELKSQIEAFAQQNGLVGALAAKAEKLNDAAKERSDGEVYQDRIMRQQLTKAEDLRALYRSMVEASAEVTPNVNKIKNIMDQIAKDSKVIFDPRHPKFDPVIAEFARLQEAINGANGSASKLSKNIDKIANIRDQIAKDKEIVFDPRDPRYDEMRVKVFQIGQEIENAGDSGDDAGSKISSAMKSAASTVDMELSPAMKRLKTVQETVSGAFERGFMSMIDGTMSVKDAFKSMASEIIKELYRIFVVKKITGFISDFIGGLTGAAPATSPRPRLRPPSLNGGGYTGPGARAGGLDGKGGYMAMIHPRETVIDHTKGQGSGGVTVIQNNTFGSGVSRAEINALMPKMVEATKAAVVDAKLRGGSYGRSFA